MKTGIGECLLQQLVVAEKMVYKLYPLAITQLDVLAT